MTTTTTNEAAERLRKRIARIDSAAFKANDGYRVTLKLDAAEVGELRQLINGAAERRATVERMGNLIWPLIRYADQAKFRAILDEEAAR